MINVITRHPVASWETTPNLYIRSSSTPRVKETQSALLEGLWGWKISPADLREDKYLGINGTEAIRKRSAEWVKHIKEGWTEDSAITSRLHWERETKPNEVYGEVITRIKNILTRVKRTGKNLIIYSSRHGEKDQSGNLSEQWRKDALWLGESLKETLNPSDTNLLITTHAGVNEGILSLLFWYDTFPEEWKKGIDFAKELKEVVKYTFSPSSDWQDSILEVERRGIKKQISFEQLKQMQ
jgi:hypothetical protein